eukprot:546394-Hanusia_phi.AAC.1
MIHQWGFKVEEVEKDSVPSSSSSSLVVVQVPSVMGVQLSPTDLLDFLQELHESLSSTPLVPQ